MEYSVVIIFIFVIILWIYFDKNKSKTKDFTNTDISNSNGNINPLHNEDHKPSLDQVKFNLEPRAGEIFNILLKELDVHYTSDLFWRGSENGWVLSTTEDQCKFGSIILGNKILEGQISLSQIQYNGIITHKELPEIIKPFVQIDTVFDDAPSIELQNFTNSMFFDGGYYHLKVQLDNKEICFAFIKLMELVKYFYQLENRI